MNNFLTDINGLNKMDEMELGINSHMSVSVKAINV